MSGVQINKNSISICTLPIFGKYLIGHKQFLSFEAKRVLVNSSFYLLFNYCPLVWTFAGAKSLNKIRGYLGNILFSSLASFVVFFFCFFFVFSFLFLLVCLFFEIKNIYCHTHSTMRAGKWYKNFHPAYFRKQDYFFFGLTYIAAMNHHTIYFWQNQIK